MGQKCDRTVLSGQCDGAVLWEAVIGTGFYILISRDQL